MEEILARLREEVKGLQGLSSRGIMNYVIMELEEIRSNPKPALIREIMRKALDMLSKEEVEIMRVREIITRELARING